MISNEWVDPKTGEIVPEFTPGAIELEVETVEPPETYGSSLEARELGDWFSKELVQLDALDAAHKIQTKRRALALKARRRSLEGYQDEVEKAARGLLVGKKKSVDFAFGRASFRKSRKVEVVDLADAMTWADEHCPEAVKTPEPTLLVSMLPKDQEIPGVVVTEDDSFSVKAAK